MKTQNEIAAICKTCKEAENQYKTLIENGLTKEEAKQIIKEAKQIINNRKEASKNEKTAVRGWFADFEKVGKSLLIGLTKEKEFNGLKKEADKFSTIQSFIENWITKADASGQPVHKVKENWKYRKITANNIRVILRECLCNIVASNNGQDVKYIRLEFSEIAQ